MKKIVSALLAAVLVLAFAGCVSDKPTIITPTTTDTATTVLPQGETKVFERNDLKLEITNVASARSEWFPFDYDDGTLEEVVVYTLYPDAQLTILNIENDNWHFCMDIPWEDGNPPSYFRINRDMSPTALTPKILSITGESGMSILRFEWAE